MSDHKLQGANLNMPISGFNLLTVRRFIQYIFNWLFPIPSVCHCW